MEKEAQIIALRELVNADPGCEELLELICLLMEKSEERIEAREICFKGLTSDPKNYKVRLFLAKLFYLDNYFEFSLRELLELRRLSEGSFPSLERLIDSYGEIAKPYISQEKKVVIEEFGDKEDEIVAELDFEADFSDVLEEIEE